MCIRDSDTTRLKDFSSVLSFAIAGRASPLLFDAISEAARTRLNDFNSQDLVNTEWSLAAVGHAIP
eukprot:8146910-Karenia_brevis.AAC.1